MLKVGMRTMDSGGEAVIIGDGPSRVQLELVKCWEYDDIQTFNKLVSKSVRDTMPNSAKPMSKYAHSVFAITQGALPGEEGWPTEYVCIKSRCTLTWFGADGNSQTRDEYFKHPVDITLRKISASQKAAVGFDCARGIPVDRASVRASKVESGILKYNTYTRANNQAEALNK